MSDACETENLIKDEIMVLQSIYEDRLEITEDPKKSFTTLTIMLYPATADDTSSQFVKLLLQLIVPDQYPDVPLDINIKSSRGLSEEHLENLLCNLKKHVDECAGTSVIFDLIEKTKDSLTFNNIPSCPCPICLEMFQDFHDFVKTECFHYLHSYCLHEYVTFQKKLFKQSSTSHEHHKPKNKQHIEELTHVPCPVCREPVTFDMALIANAKEPVDPKPDAFDISKFKREVEELRKIYDRQKELGGIIDLEAEKNKHLISSIEQSHANSSSFLTSATPDDNATESTSSSYGLEENKEETVHKPTSNHGDRRTHHRRSDRNYRASGYGGGRKETDGKSLADNVSLRGKTAKHHFPYHGRQTPTEPHYKSHHKPNPYNSSFKRMDRGRGKTLSTKHSTRGSRTEFADRNSSSSKQTLRDSKAHHKTESQSAANERNKNNHNVKPPPGFS